MSIILSALPSHKYAMATFQGKGLIVWRIDVFPLSRSSVRPFLVQPAHADGLLFWPDLAAPARMNPDQSIPDADANDRENPWLCFPRRLRTQLSPEDVQAQQSRAAQQQNHRTGFRHIADKVI